MAKHSDPLALKALELVEKSLEDQEEAALKRASEWIRKGELTGQRAVQILCEIDSLRKIPKNLMKMQRLAIAKKSSADVDND